MTSDHRSRRARLATVAAVALAGITAAMPVVAMAPPAAAHPFGPPLTARLDVDANRVSVQWSAAEDDWVNLGEHLDAFVDETDTANPRTGAQMLAESDNLPSYLLSHIAVAQNGQPCTGTVEPVSDRDLLAEGVQLAFECPQEVTEIELEITALTDVDENYRTVVSSDVPSQPQQSLFTSSTPTQSWDFTASGSSGVLQLALVAGGIVVVAAAGGLVWQRRRAAEGRRAEAGHEHAA